jgi:hypothetical protein
LLKKKTYNLRYLWSVFLSIALFWLGIDAFERAVH